MSAYPMMSPKKMHVSAKHGSDGDATSPDADASDVDDLRASLRHQARKGQVETACALLLQIAKAVPGPMDVNDCNNYLYACAQARDLKKAEHFLNMMEACNLQPDVQSYNTVLNLLAKFGSLDGLEDCLRRLMERVVPTASTFSALCNYYARERDVSSVTNIMAAVTRCGMEVNEYFYSSLVTAYGEQAQENLHKIKAALITYFQNGFSLRKLRTTLVNVFGDKQADALVREVVSSSKLCCSRSTTLASCSRSAPEAPSLRQRTTC